MSGGGRDTTGLARDTLYVAAGRDTDLPGRSVNPPIVRASTFLFNSLQELESAAKAPFDGAFYGRLGTPTTFAFERAMAQAEGGYRSIATGSGLSAIVAVLVGFLKTGDHALIVDSVYEPVRRFCHRVLAGMGVEVTFYDPGLGAAELEPLIRTTTRLIYMESPGSGTFEVQDVPAIVALAKRRQLVTAMDNTWATPLYYRPIEHGVDISIHAATKYIVGHSDAVLGVVTTNEATWGPVRQASQDLGASAGSEECNLGLRGLHTLAVRMRQHEATALTLARWLAEQPAVSRVFHPALESSPGHAHWKRDFDGSSGLFSIELGGMSATAFDAFTSALKLFSIGFSWGGFESLILPAHPEKTRTAPAWQGTGPLLRLHAGLEDPADLLADLQAGFVAAARTKDTGSP
ncbi:cystathionine beta-lyase [Variovorax sp. N23]|uniref:cystathionine beta-lyase n=1 Tax=Variovorax sp. N23 TaxID=2980555 RepID=UPI0021CAE1F2|nr:cystathionine beta-lyase [Variovorax sp. N23]MCU4118788.1 cystathionine beta-lyase [Variovorax sp. N23]